MLIDEASEQIRRQEETDHFVPADRDDGERAAPRWRGETREAEVHAKRDEEEKHDPAERDRDPFHGGGRKRNARHQRRARIVGVSLARTGTSAASLSRSPSRKGQVPSCAAERTLPAMMSSCARPPRWIRTIPANTPPATRHTRDPSRATAPTAHAATG